MELASTSNLGFTIPQTTTTFNPAWSAPTYRPSDFMAAYQFAPRPIAPDAYSGALNQLGATIGQVTSPQFQLAKYQEGHTLRALQDEAKNPTVTVQQPAQTLALPVASPTATDGTGGFVATATGYHPVSPDSPEYKMEGGNLDAQGNPIHTLDAFRRGETPDVTVAVDKSSPLFGRAGYSVELNAPVKFTDTGAAFQGKGTSRVDIARDTSAGANSDENNRPLSFTLGGAQGTTPQPPAPLFGWKPNVAPSGNIGPLVPVGGTAGAPRATAVTPLPATPSAPEPAVTQPLALPAQPPLSPWRAQLQNALGPGHITVNPNGTVGYAALPPLNAADQNDLAEKRALFPLRVSAAQDEHAFKTADTAAQQSRADHYAALTRNVGLGGSTDGTVGKNDTPEALERAIASKGGDATGLRDANGNFDRAEALKRLSAVNVDAPSAPLLTPEAIEAKAAIRLINPKDPAGTVAGMGKEAVEARAAIDNRAAAIMKDTGLTGTDAAVAHLGVNASATALNAQEKQRAAIEGFEQTARDNAKIALDLLDKGAGGPTGIPVFNRWIQAGRRGTGDADVAAFDTAIGAFKNEYAKIISGSTGSAGASDSARKEAETLINKGGTPEQLRAQLDVAFQEMQNRSKSINGQISNLNDSIRKAATPKNAAANSSASINTPPPLVRVRRPDGKTGSIPAADLPAALAAGATQL